MPRFGWPDATRRRCQSAILVGGTLRQHGCNGTLGQHGWNDPLRPRLPGGAVMMACRQAPEMTPRGARSLLLALVAAAERGRDVARRPGREVQPGRQVGQPVGQTLGEAFREATRQAAEAARRAAGDS